MNNQRTLRSASKSYRAIPGASLVLRVPAFVLACVFLNPSANAQSGDPDEQSLEEITVTGSRITNSNIVSPIPTQQLDIGEIQAAGTIDLGELVEQLPGVYLGVSPTNSQLSTQVSGLSTIDLRGLSTNRTLTLINGRRVVSNSGSAQRVDTSTIPTGFVDRIDITTGGASAAYGSDAIAGVANIILKDSFNGLEVDARYGDSADGGNENPSFSATWGSDFADGRGNLMIGGSWENKDPVMATQREYARSNLEIDLETGELEPNNSSFLPGGRFEGDAWNIGGVWQNDNNYCINDGRVPACDDYQEAFDGWDFRPFNMIFPERERWSTMAKTNFEFTETLTGSLMLQFSESETRAERTPAGVNDSNTYGPFDNETAIGDIPDAIPVNPTNPTYDPVTGEGDNPFIHPAVWDTLSGTVDWRRRMTEVGNRDRNSVRTTQRMAFSLDGQFNDRWSWNGYVGYGKFRQEQEKHNEVNRLNIQYAINIMEDPANDGSYICQDAGARADGCVPLNVFGEGSITPEAADYIRHTIMMQQELKQTTASFSVSGDIFELPAGDAQIAAGIDFRKEEQWVDGDPVTNAGLTSSSTLLDVQADFDVTEAFVELNVPLIAGKTGIEALDMTTAFRAADYSTIGDVSSWNFGLSYTPVEDVRFRAQISQAQRAPDITELFSPQRSDFDDFNDPCDGVTAATTGVVADNCRQDAGIASEILLNGVFDQDGSQIFGPSLGNINLIEETADTFTAGFVLAPRALDGFTLIADYYKIEVEDAISSVDSQLAGDLCYSDPNFPNNRFCPNITRGNDGQVSRIINQEENLNSLVSEGIDVTLAYDFEIAAIPGDFETSIIYAHIMKNEASFDGPDGEVIDDFAGEVGLPEHEYRGTIRWSTDAFSVRYRLKYSGTVRDDNDTDPADIFGFVRFEQTLIHDIYASYKFGNEHRYRVYAGINNIENQTGPYLPDGYASGENANVGDSYDRVGRRFYLGLKFDW
ncbi:MAG: TonB-dependent receptor [Gammaproteobacteria bacterium]|nr:TonB-dependent receptor [Gammaproteobacteria bacterium]